MRAHAEDVDGGEAGVDAHDARGDDVADSGDDGLGAAAENLYAGLLQGTEGGRERSEGHHKNGKHLPSQAEREGFESEN